MRIGIDLGGTKIEALAMDDAGRIIARHRVATPPQSYQATIDAIKQLVETIEAQTGERGSVGVGAPGAISPATGRVKNANSTCLNGERVDVDLSRALAREVRLQNDANCFALSEATDGAASGASVVFGVIVGTGTGGGVVIDGSLLTGPNAIAGEWGHNPLPWPNSDELPGPACYCGRSGCVECYLSGPGFANEYYRMAGEELEPAAIVACAAEGDALAEACTMRYEDRMARSLSQVINMLDPDVIVLGGGMSKINRLYTNVPLQWDSYVFSDRVDTRLVPPRHGDASGGRGAAWLWPTSLPPVKR